MSEQPYFGCALTAASATSGLGFETTALAAAALLGGIAGAQAGITDAAGAIVNPRLNLLITGSNSARYRRAQDLLLSPIEECQETLRGLSAAVNRERAEALASSHTAAGATNAIVAARPEDDFNATDSEHQRRLETLRLPGVMLRNPHPSHFSAALDEILDGCALITYPEGNFLDVALQPRRPKALTQHLAAVTDAVVGGDQARSKLERHGYGTTQNLRASLLVACTANELQQAITAEEPDLKRLLRQCVFADIPGEHAVPAITLKATRDGYFFYQETVRQIFIARRAGGGVQFEPDEQWASQMHEYVIALRGWLDELPSHLAPYFATALSLPYKLLWTLRALAARGESREWCVPAAIHATNWVLARQRRLLSRLIADTAHEEHERARHAMLQKLADGPQLFRDLIRRYSVQRKDVHIPILDELVNEGCVSLRSDGLLELTRRRLIPRAHWKSPA